LSKLRKLFLFRFLPGWYLFKLSISNKLFHRHHIEDHLWMTHVTWFSASPTVANEARQEKQQELKKLKQMRMDP